MESRKIKMSKRLLKETLIELLQNKTIAQISVKSLCEAADLNRSTFYAHYEDIYALIDDIENDVIENMPFVVYSEKPSRKYIMDYAAYIEKNYSAFVALIRNGRLIQKTIDKSMKFYLSDGEKDKENQEIFKIITHYYIGGLFHALLYWSDHEKIVSLQDISQIIYKLLNQAVKIRIEAEK